MSIDVGDRPQPPLWAEPEAETESGSGSASGSSDGPQGLLLDAIAAGDLDEHLVALADAIHARRELLYTVRSAAAIAEFSVGDPVRLNRQVRPRYLHGEIGMVVDRDDYAVTVRLLHPIGRFRSGEVRCPPLLLDKLDPVTWRPAA